MFAKERACRGSVRGAARLGGGAPAYFNARRALLCPRAALQAVSEAWELKWPGLAALGSLPSPTKRRGGPWGGGATLAGEPQHADWVDLSAANALWQHRESVAFAGGR